MMSQSGVAEGGESRLDLAGLALIAVVALVSGVLAVVGTRYAAWVFLFASGALVGDGLMYLAIRSRRWRMPLAVGLILLLAVVLAWFSVSFFLWLRPPWEDSAPLAFFALGVASGFGGLVLGRLFDPWVVFRGPRTWDEAVEQRRDMIHGTLVFGGFFLAIVGSVAALIGVLYLIARAVAAFG
jgi:hypothetical protein